MPAVQSRPIGMDEQEALCETNPFRHARERTYLHWPVNVYPCRTAMKDAGWFITRTTDGRLVAVCVYCNVACEGWTREHDPCKVHRLLSPDCIFVRSAHRVLTPSSPLVDLPPRRRCVRPSTHPMAMVTERARSFEQWPPQAARPSVDALTNAGLFYTEQNTIVECFYCHGQHSITRADDDSMSTHTAQCAYARHLQGHNTRTLHPIAASRKTYAYETLEVENITFYYLRCADGKSPGILISAKMTLTEQQASETAQTILNRLHPTDHEHRGINPMGSLDGPLVCILERLAASPIPLTNDAGYLIDPLPPPETDSSATRSFHCKMCLLHDTSPYTASSNCGHPGPCVQGCHPKWSTCVICGYTLGRLLRIYNP